MPKVRSIAPLGLIAGLVLLYFAPLVLHPTRTLYADHSDLIALHVPFETFLARAWRLDGERPLWNPLQFAGLPFAHDVQAAISYPPHALFRLVGEGQVGATLSWLIVTHVVLAGWGMYVYTRATGLGAMASLVGSLGFLFAGKWLLHLLLAGHYAFAGLAWLPWALLGLHRAIERRSLLAATWGGFAFGMLALSTHPQLTLYCGLFAAIWTFPFALEAGSPRVRSSLAGGHRLDNPRHGGGRERSVVRIRGALRTDHVASPSPAVQVEHRSSALAIPRRALSRNGRPGLSRWLASGLWAAAIGVSLAAVQLVPSLDAARESSRGTVGLPESPSFSLRALLRTLGPSPTGAEPVTSWEPRCGLGLAWLAVAATAPILTQGRDRRRAKWAITISLGLAAFALGGAGLFQGLPGFRMFRQPARIFLVASLPVAYLVALATQALLDRPGPSPEAKARARRVVTLAAVLMLAWLAIAVVASGPGKFRFHPYWLALIVTLPAVRRLVGADLGRFGRIAWVGVLLLDLVAQTWPHLRVRDLDEVLAPSAAARYVAEHSGPLDRVLDRSLPGHQSSTPLGPAVATRLGLQSIRGYNALDLVRYKEFLAVASAPIPIGNPYNGLINAPILHKGLLDLLGVRFLVQPVDPALRSTHGEPDPDLDPSWQRVALDPAPSAFTFAAGGVRTLPPFEVLENRDAFPRAFVVPSVAPLPADRESITRALTTTDFRRVALVESPTPLDVGPGTGSFLPATVLSYRPNRIELEADGPGLLVLADPWSPDWLATVDDAPARLVRADYAFRGVPLPPGCHTVAFAFRPRSYEIGRTVSLATLGLIVVITGIGILSPQDRRSPDRPFSSNLEH
jgi:hypothetical protein